MSHAMKQPDLRLSPEETRRALERQYVISDSDSPQQIIAKVRAGTKYLYEKDIAFPGGKAFDLTNSLLEEIDETLHELWRGDTTMPLNILFVLFLLPDKPMSFSMTVQEKKDICGSRGFYAEAVDKYDGTLAQSGGGSAIAAMQRTLLEVIGNDEAILAALAIGSHYSLRVSESYAAAIEGAINDAVFLEYSRQMWPDSKPLRKA